MGQAAHNRRRNRRRVLDAKRTKAGVTRQKASVERSDVAEVPEPTEVDDAEETPQAPKKLPKRKTTKK